MRGIRNNNPGNIRYDGTKWLGLSDPSNDGSFCCFTEVKYGIRAMTIVLLNYQNKHGLNTINQIINRWAPMNENDTKSYVSSVAQFMEIKSDEKIILDFPTLSKLCNAIIRHENGICPYSDLQIQNGIELALSNKKE